jgi:hypothetical protein
VEARCCSDHAVVPGQGTGRHQAVAGKALLRPRFIWLLQTQDRDFRRIDDGREIPPIMPPSDEMVKQAPTCQPGRACRHAPFVAHFGADLEDTFVAS